jgi:hypothetical protein
MNVDAHKNIENVIRYYLLFLPPRGCKSILDIGAGRSMPYKGVLQYRTNKYASLDIRQNNKGSIDHVVDLTEGTTFKKGQWHWGWCSEVIEHIPTELKEIVVKEILRICKNVVFTFPTPLHKSFHDDPGHVEVKLNPREIAKSTHKLFYDKSTKSGRNIWIFAQRNKPILFEKNGLCQDDCDKSNLTFYVDKNKNKIFTTQQIRF